MQKKSEPISFNVYPEKGKKDYYKVYVFKNKKDMRSRARIINGFSALGFVDFEAVTYIYECFMKKKGKMTLLPRRGDVLFYEGGFGAGVVAHEMVHVANYHANEHGWSFNVGKRHINTEKWKRMDEKYAWVVGSLCNQFWRKYKKKVNINKESY